MIRVETFHLLFIKSIYMSQFLSRRNFILIPIMSIFKIIFNPLEVFASKEEWNLSKEEWKNRLSPESYYILREEGTERAFSSQLNNEKRKGIFLLRYCDQPLSDTKYDSGTGQIFGIQFRVLSKQRLILN